MTPPGRKLALCDAENLCLVAPDRASATQLESGLLTFAEHSGLDPADHVVIASHPNGRAVFAARSIFPGGLLRVRHGADGADTALRDEISDIRFIASRFDQVMIASGDGIFTEPVVALNEAGVHTVVISWSHKLSRRLRLAASEVRTLTARPTRESHGNPAEQFSA